MFAQVAANVDDMLPGDMAVLSLVDGMGHGLVIQLVVLD
jgi:hypothetical protein